MADDKNDKTARAAAGRKPDHRRAPREAREAARAGPGVPNDFRRSDLAADLHAAARREDKEQLEAEKPAAAVASPAACCSSA